MTYATIMVSLTPGRSNARLVEIAAAIARRFDAGLIGHAACRPIHCVAGDYAIPAGVFEEDRKQIDRQLRESEHAFRTALASFAGRIEWKARMSTVPLADHLAGESRSADLIVIEGDPAGAAGDVTRRPDLCDLVMQAGRPVLLVPATGAAPAFERVMVAWKDAREARRAIADALSFLAKAAKVTVVGIAAADAVADTRNSLVEIVAWLGHHGVKAETEVALQSSANAPQLRKIAGELNADLVVAGAYGYSRLGKWVLGGITSELLGGDLCALVSH